VNWSTPQILAAIALLAALFGGGAVWFAPAEPRVGSVGLVLAVLLLAVAVLVS
jgi:hypothetical protein